MIRKRKTIPDQSVLKPKESTFNYIDSFQGEIIRPKHDIGIEDVGILFLSRGPKWAISLLKVRDKIVGVFGLKTSAEMRQEQDSWCGLKAFVIFAEILSHAVDQGTKRHYLFVRQY